MFVFLFHFVRLWYSCQPIPLSDFPHFSLLQYHSIHLVITFLSCLASKCKSKTHHTRHSITPLVCSCLILAKPKVQKVSPREYHLQSKLSLDPHVQVLINVKDIVFSSSSSKVLLDPIPWHMYLSGFFTTYSSTQGELNPDPHIFKLKDSPTEITEGQIFLSCLFQEWISYREMPLFQMIAGYSTE